MKIYKTTITVYSDYDPTNRVDAEDLVRDAICGDCYLGSQGTIAIESGDLDEGIQEFFSCSDDDEDSDTPLVYKSEFGWGFIGCESDCYATKEEAEAAAKES